MSNFGIQGGSSFASLAATGLFCAWSSTSPVPSPERVQVAGAGDHLCAAVIEQHRADHHLGALLSA